MSIILYVMLGLSFWTAFWAGIYSVLYSWRDQSGLMVVNYATLAFFPYLLPTLIVLIAYDFIISKKGAGP